MTDPTPKLPPISYKVVRAPTADELEDMLNAAAAEGWVLHSVAFGVGPHGFPVAAVMEKKNAETGLGHSGR